MIEIDLSNKCAQPTFLPKKDCLFSILIFIIYHLIMPAFFFLKYISSTFFRNTYFDILTDILQICYKVFQELLISSQHKNPCKRQKVCEIVLFFEVDNCFYLFSSVSIPPLPVQVSNASRINLAVLQVP